MGEMKDASGAVSAVDYLLERYVNGKPEMEALLAEVREEDEIARQIYTLRTEAGLSQRALAKRVGTTASVICRLESADYEGHSLSMLRRVAAALNSRVSLKMVPIEPSVPAQAAAVE
jgi:ribosome-binding protein aMBF1 (putative translation factor)